MIKAVLFDLDGTLVNSLDDLANATNFALQKNGFPGHKTEKYKYFVGDGMLKLIERSLPENRRDSDTLSKVHKDFLEYYGEHFFDLTTDYEGIKKVLYELKKDGFMLLVISNKAEVMAKLVVEKVFGDVFDVVVGKREGYPAKPDPALTLKIIQELKISPKECVFIGDSGMDMKTAVSCGCVPVGVLWGFRTEKELKENGAEYLLSHPQQISVVIKDINDA